MDITDAPVKQKIQKLGQKKMRKNKKCFDDAEYIDDMQEKMECQDEMNDVPPQFAEKFLISIQVFSKFLLLYSIKLLPEMAYLALPNNLPNIDFD